MSGDWLSCPPRPVAFDVRTLKRGSPSSTFQEESQYQRSRGVEASATSGPKGFDTADTQPPLAIWGVVGLDLGLEIRSPRHSWTRRFSAARSLFLAAISCIIVCGDGESAKEVVKREGDVSRLCLCEVK
eukprot:4717043-Pleurochrysis_carterae.AAC.2